MLREFLPTQPGAETCRARIRQGVILLCALLVAAGGAAHLTAQEVPATAENHHDPALRTGVLPNGLHYYVRANAMPANRAYLWLAINAGSALEDDDQLGYAHFLEHMAFNGTERFPQQELIGFIESSGMRFGADLNAYVNFDETVYQLTVPTDDPGLLERGLSVLEDWAGGGITIDSAEVVAERGVVLGEWRSRTLVDSAGERLREHELEVLFGDSRYRDRLPIGTPESIEAATPEPIARFYRDWYRPDLMAVIAVGDFDPAEMEREIRERFGGIQPPANPRPRPDLDLPVRDRPQVDVLRGRVAPHVTVFWPAPAREPAGGAEGVRSALRREMQEQLLLGHVQGELLRMRERGSPPYVNAVVGQQRLVRGAEVVSTHLVAFPDSLERGLAAVLTELERVAQHGVEPATLERRKAALLRRLEEAAASATARPSSGFAAAYVQHYLNGSGVLASAEQRLAIGRELLDEITPETMAAAARFWRDETGLRVMVRIPQLALGFRPPTEESVLAVFDSVRRAELAPVDSRAEVQAAVAEGVLMTDPPAPGRIVEERTHAGAEVEEWTLSNGARVLFRQSANHPDEVLVRAWSPGGFSRVPDPLFFSSGRLVAHVLNEAAGLGDQDRATLVDDLSTTGVRRSHVHIGYGHESVEVEGSPRELETLFQMLHLQFTAPRLDSAALETWANVARYHPRAVTIHDQLNQVFARGNPRLAPVQTQTAELARLDEVMAVHADRFGNAGDFVFLVVGAAPAEEVRPLVERYIASLPATDERETPRDPAVRRFVDRMQEQNRVVPVPRSEVLLAFDGAFPTEPEEYLRERQRLDALTLVLERRLRDRLREELGGTYGVAVQGFTYRLYDEHFRTFFGFQAAPERMTELTREMHAILNAVREQGADEAELERVARILDRRRETQLQSNRYWLDQLTLFHRLGLPLERIVVPGEGGAIDPESIRQAAEQYLPVNASIQVTQVPTEEVMAEARRAAREDAPGGQ